MADGIDEDLSENPLFAAFASSSHYAAAASLELIVVVPVAASLTAIGRPSHHLLETHLLRASPYHQHEYVSVSGRQTVVLLGRSLQGRSGFSAPRTVTVLADERHYYDDGDGSFQVLRVDLPLEGKVPPEYLKALQLQQEEADDQRGGIERRTVAEHEAALLRIGGDACIASVQRFVHQFNTSYVLVKGFIHHAGQKVSDACVRLREEILQAARQRKSDGRGGGRGGGSASVLLLEVQTAVEAVVLSGVYKKLFAGLCELQAREEEQLQAGVLSMRRLTQQELGVRDAVACSPSAALQLMAALAAAPTPLLQMGVLEQVSRAIAKAVRDQPLLRDGGDGEAVDGQRDTVLSAEDMIPLTLYALLHSGLQHIAAHLAFLHHFSFNKGAAFDHLLVHLANFQAAAQIIQAHSSAAAVDADAALAAATISAADDGSSVSGPLAASPLSSLSDPSSPSLASRAALNGRASQHAHARSMSSSSSLSSLASLSPSYRHRSPSSSPQPPLSRPTSLRTDDESASLPAAPRNAPRPPLGSSGSTSRAQSSAAAGSASPDDGSEASASTGSRRGARSRSARPQRVQQPAAAPPPPVRSTFTSTNPFETDSPVADGGSAAHFSFQPQQAAAASSSSSSSQSQPSRAANGRPAAQTQSGIGGLGDFLSRLKESDDVVTGSLRVIRQR